MRSIVDRGELGDDYVEDRSALWIVTIGVIGYVSLLGFGSLMGWVVWELMAGGAS